MKTSPPSRPEPDSRTRPSWRDEWVDRLLRFEPHSDLAGAGAALMAASGVAAAVWFNFTP